jgi:ApaG protein
MHEGGIYEKTTGAIRVTVRPIYLEAQSSPADDHFVWAYQVNIENHGGETVQLLGRYWHITDARGHIQEVRGAGVVGEQPTLGPGERFEYTSGCPLPTPSGMMVGRYRMVRRDGPQAGETFEIDVPAFSLDSPHQVIQPN